MLRLVAYIYAYVQSVVRVVVIIMCALLLPRLFVAYVQREAQDNQSAVGTSHISVQTAIDTDTTHQRYSFLALLNEVHPFDIGAGSECAGQCVLLPASRQISKNKWHELRQRLKRLGVESAAFGYYHEGRREQCSGLKLFIQDPNGFSSFKTLLVILQFFKDAGVDLRFEQGFDAAMGNSCVRQFIEGSMRKDEFAREMYHEKIVFAKERGAAR